MENKFLNSLAGVTNTKLTENGAIAHKSTLSHLLDLFGTIGALRTHLEGDEAHITQLFAEAFAEDSIHAMKCLFYARDIRGGLGERDVCRVIFEYMANNHTHSMRKNLQWIPTFGRWDDLYSFVGTPLEVEAFKIMKDQLDEDLKNLENGKNVSLLAKWLKSENTSSHESRRLARITMTHFGYSQKKYRTTLSMLRRKIQIVETEMSANSWGSIDYEAVPSKAMSNYSNAFRRHDEERFNEYMTAVNSGEAKINASTLFPYDIGKKMMYMRDSKEDYETAKAQWEALPNYVSDADFLIMADTSGSMSGLPMEVSVSLAIYFAERNKGLYHNKFMTFSESPTFIELADNLSLREKFNKVLRSDWGYNTDLERAFMSILNAAVKSKCSQEELPKALVVITDMEIDHGADMNDDFTSDMRSRFEAAGYKMPTLVWWNVDARQNTFHAEFSDPDVRFVSGCSAAIFKGLCENLGDTAIDLMLRTLDDPRYDCITA